MNVVLTFHTIFYKNFKTYIMKKIIFILAFVLTASICFANNSIEKTNFIELNKTVNADNSLIYSVSVSVEKEELFGR
jgi:hypothetical protein